MNLGIVGAGYVGLTTGICLAMQNHNIIVYDIDSNKINTIKNSFSGVHFGVISGPFSGNT